MPKTADSTILSFMNDIKSRYTGAENLLGQVANTVSMDAKIVNLYATEIKNKVPDRVVASRFAPAPPSRRAAGGYISGPGSGTSDSIPAMLSNGEYVISAKAVQAAGLPMLDRINKMGKGGPVYDVPAYSMGGRVKYNTGGMATSSNSLYNINVTLNGSNLNPNDVARAIDNQMRLREAMNGRGRTI